MITITLARKPLSEGSVARNVLRWGTGGLHIDASRIRLGDTGGRWPANVVFQHLPGCQRVGVTLVRGHRGYPNGPKGNQGRNTYSDRWDESWGDQAVSGYADADGNEAVEVWDCIEQCPVDHLNRQTVELPPVGMSKGVARFFRVVPPSDW